jgi:hypothetical protein
MPRPCRIPRDLEVRHSEDEPPALAHSARQIVRDAVVPPLKRRSTDDSRPLMTTVGETIHIDESRRDCQATSRSVTEEVKENAHTPADMVGNLVAEAAARCRAEPDIM